MPVVGRMKPREVFPSRKPPTRQSRMDKDFPGIPEDDRTAAAWARSAHHYALTQYYPLHRQWAINKAIHIGNQYAAWSENHRQVVANPKTPRHRVRATINVTHPVIQTMTAMLLKTRPRPIVKPASTMPKDLDAAKMGEKLLDFLWRDSGMDEKEQLISSTMFETGTCFVKVIWDTSLGPVMETVDDDGDPLTDPETNEPMVDSEGHPYKFQMGRVDVEFVPPWQVLPDPNAHFLGECSWIIHTRMRPLGWIREHFEWGKYISHEEEGSANHLEYQFNRYTAGNLDSSVGANPGESEWARVNEVWIKPGTRIAGKIYPDGGIITQCQGFSSTTENPYLQARGANPEKDWHPFVQFRCYEVGRFWPIGVVDLLQPIQREINRITSNLIEAQRLMSRPKWLIPTTAGIGKGQLDSEPGEKVYYSPVGGKPEPAVLSPIPQYVFALLEKMYENVDFVSGQHGPSRGQAPTGIKSGIGLSLLQEQDATDLLPISKNWEGALSRLGRLMLLRVHQFWHIDRLVTVVGEDSQVEAFNFSNADLGSNVDVEVLAGSGLPKSKAAQQALVEKLVTLGILSPMVPQHRRVIMQMLELGIPDDLYRSEDLDRRRARHENELLLRGIQPRVMWYEDHNVHIEEHLREMKSDRYMAMIADDPMAEVRFNMHLAAHANPQNEQVLQSIAGARPQSAGAHMDPGAVKPGQMGMNNSTDSTYASNLQSPQANREQTMGGENASSENPSMGG